MKNRCHDFGRVAASCLLAAACLVSLCRADDTPDMGYATVTVRGPLGQLLPNRPLRFFLTDPVYPEYIPPAAVTDARGQATVALPPGLRRAHVVVPGVGFGTTGTLVVRSDRTATEPMPPLAAFARVSGVVPAALRAPGETVTVQNPSNDRAEDVPPAPVDAQGRFVLSDVFPGSVSLTLSAGAQSDYCQVNVAPGEALAGVTFAPPWHAPWRGPDAPAPTTTVSLRGTVTDDTGAAVPGAEVLARVPQSNPPMAFGGPFRQEPPPLMATTGPDGGYIFPGIALGNQAETIALRAVRAGHPPADLVVKTAAGQTDDVRADLVIPTRHTALTVRVLQGGQPLAGASVTVGPQTSGPGIFAVNYGLLYTANDPMGGRLTATTGADGRARFVDLPPGLWDVYAYAGTSSTNALTANDGAVAVETGESAICTLRVVPPLTEGLPVTPLGPDGVPLAAPTGNFQGLGFSGGGGTVLTAGVDERQHLASLTQPGLWRVIVRTHDFPAPYSGWYTDTSEPYLEASALVAVSPDLPPPAPLCLWTRRHERATLHVQLEDAAGRPARGTVMLSISPMSDYAASTDARGQVDFPEMVSGRYTVRGCLAGRPPPPPLGDGPLPVDAALVGQTRFEPQTVTLDSDSTPTVTLRPQPVGYVRLHLAPAPPGTLQGFNVSDTSRPNTWQDFPQQRNDDRTGDILYGPTTVGPDTLYVTQYSAQGGSHSTGTVSVMVRQDAVTRVSLIPSPPGPATSFDPSEADPVMGTVVLHDGTTPAWNAHAVLCLPEPGWPSPQLTPQQPADARGRLLGMTTNFADGGYVPPVVLNGHTLPPSPPSGSAPAGPVVVAWMPGLTGAALVPYARGRALRIVLPPALNAVGTVTVAGQPVGALGGTFRVRAAYQGLGALDGLLTLDVSARPDGTFTLPGLTPGTYQVQAARDGIWLSTTQTLVVGSTPPPPLALDIPAPGVSIALHLTDAQGHALPGRAVSLDPPAGPLADLLWPAFVTADGAGDLHLDGLTAGAHTLRDPGTGAVLAGFSVPPWEGGAPRAEVQRGVTLPLTGRETMP